jgi:hypothetical protein
MSSAEDKVPASMASRVGRGLRGLPLIIARALDSLAIVSAPSPSIDIEELLGRIGKSQKALG